jgi:hypothetical protein
MKSRILFFLIVTIFLQIPANAQKYDDMCGTVELSQKKIEKLPWYGNNQYLYNLLDSSGYFDKRFSHEKVLYRIPVTFWVYRNNDGTGGPPESELREMMINLNMPYINNNTGILFYLAEINYIDKLRHRRLGYYWEAPWQNIVRHNKNTVNVYICENIEKRLFFFMRKRSVRGTYNHFTNSIMVRRFASTTTLAHEVGHFLGLLHPHRNANRGKCKQEAVRRDRRFKGCLKTGLICEKNGDALCDTPAEPKLWGYVNENCEYRGHKKDNWGDEYKPNTTNVMSYPTHLKCRHEFTPGQIGVMLHTLKEIDICGWSADCGRRNQQYYFDAFEPDNTKDMASQVYFNTPQQRTFHKTYQGKSEPDADKDVDWCKFEVKSKDNRILITTSKGEYRDPDTKLYLYDDDGQLIETNDDNGKETYSQIGVNNLKPGWYFIKIEKKKIMPGGYLFDYTLTLQNLKK